MEIFDTKSSSSLKKDVFIEGKYVQTIYRNSLCVTINPIFCTNPKKFEQFPIELYEQTKRYAAIEFMPQIEKVRIQSKANFANSVSVVILGLTCLLDLIGDKKFESIDYFIGQTNVQMLNAIKQVGFYSEIEYLDIVISGRQDLISNKERIKEILRRAKQLNDDKYFSKYRINSKPIIL